ncbi:MAG TPA: sugar ABC transporter permease [Candidatus Hydrogenedentes bacterium]|nr:sugar ABC transporter permease [Candidatus Hydrogenedentota bacterium]
MVDPMRFEPGQTRARRRRVRGVLQALRPGRFYLYLTPTFAFLAVFAYYPPLLAFYRSFYDWDGVRIEKWAGIGNYVNMFHDEVLLRSVWNLAQLTVFAVAVSVVFPLLTAELICSLRNRRAQFWHRVLLVVPMVVPIMVQLLLWKFIYDPNVGLLNALLRLVRIPSQAWLHEPKLALYSMMFMAFPFVGAINVLIFLAGLNNIGQPVFDAAKIDGASVIQRFFRIDVPLVKGQIKLIVILTIIGTLNGYGTQLILTDGGPGYSTMVPALRMYQQAFRFNHLGYACAIGMALFAAIFGLTFINMKLMRTDYE